MLFIPYTWWFMVRTRSSIMATDITKIIDEKFEVFKNSVLAEFKKTILDEIRKDTVQLFNKERENIDAHFQSKTTILENELGLAES